MSYVYEGGKCAHQNKYVIHTSVQVYMPTQVCVHIGAQKLPSPIVCCLPGWTLMALHLEGAQGAAVCPALTAA